MVWVLLHWPTLLKPFGDLWVFTLTQWESGSSPFHTFTQHNPSSQDINYYSCAYVHSRLHLWSLRHLKIQIVGLNSCKGRNTARLYEEMYATRMWNSQQQDVFHVLPCPLCRFWPLETVLYNSETNLINLMIPLLTGSFFLLLILSSTGQLKNIMCLLVDLLEYFESSCTWHRNPGGLLMMLLWILLVFHSCHNL